MGYIIKNTPGLVNTKFTDAARQRLSQGNFNISYFQVGDSEVTYNVLPNSYNQRDTFILEPNFNSQNSSGIPESNKQYVKYPYYVDGNQGNTYGIPYLDSTVISIYNKAIPRGFFKGISGLTGIEWSAITNNYYVINSNYVIDISSLNSSEYITLIPSTCNVNSVREPEVGDFITIYYDGAYDNCVCGIPVPPVDECYLTGFTLTISIEGDFLSIFFYPTDEIVNSKPVFGSDIGFVIYWDGNEWVLDSRPNGQSEVVTLTNGNTPITDISGIETYCGNYGEGICLSLCSGIYECQYTSVFTYTMSGQTIYIVDTISADIEYSGSSWVLISSDIIIATLSGLTENDKPIGNWDTSIGELSATTLTSTLGVCSQNKTCNCLTITAVTGNDSIIYQNCNRGISSINLISGETQEICVNGFNNDSNIIWWNDLSGNTSGNTGCTSTVCGPITISSISLLDVNDCFPTPTPTPSATVCPTPTPSPQCPPPTATPTPECVMSMSSCYSMLTYRIVEVCKDGVIKLDRTTPYFSSISGSCYARTLIYPPNMTTIYDTTTPMQHWSEGDYNFESVCDIDQYDVKVWNMNIPWSENPAGLINTISEDYTKFGSITYLGTKEYLGYASSSGQIFFNPLSNIYRSTDSYYYNSLDNVVFVEPEEQKSIAIIHYTNQTIDNMYGEKFALEPLSNLDSLTGFSGNFKLHIPWLMWHKGTDCCNGQTFWVEPPGFSGLDLSQVNYMKSTKNPDMNQPGLRYFQLWDNHANSDGYPNRIGKVFPDDKIIVIDDEEVIAAMSYKSNRNWTLPAPQISLITPNICGLDVNSFNGVLTGSNEYMYVTYRLSNTQDFTNSLHCDYYSKIEGPNLQCSPSKTSQNVAINFGPEFNCMNVQNLPCWYSGFNYSFSVDSPFNFVLRFEPTGESTEGFPIYGNPLGVGIYKLNNDWVVDSRSSLFFSPEILTISGSPSSPIGLVISTGTTGYTFCGEDKSLCIQICILDTEPFECLNYFSFNLDANGTYNSWSTFFGGEIYYSSSTSNWVMSNGMSGVIAELSGLTENDLPIGNWDTSMGVYSADTISTSQGFCSGYSHCDCFSFTGTSDNTVVQYRNCNTVINELPLMNGEVQDICVYGIGNNVFSIVYYEGVISGSAEFTTGCTASCTPIIPYTITTDSTCNIQPGYIANKFEIICQKVESNIRPDSSEWRIIDFTDQMSAYTDSNGNITEQGLISNTFVITNELYDNAPTYNLNDYISLTPVNYSGVSLNFGDEFYFYGLLETDIEASVYEMRYKINLSVNEFKVPSNPTWTSGNTSYVTEIGLYDSNKNLMIVSKLQSPVVRQGIQQFLVKFDL